MNSTMKSTPSAKHRRSAQAEAQHENHISNMQRLQAIATRALDEAANLAALRQAKPGVA